ncbi:hypothetical protein WMY93_030276 [Mugilogobius chulae]|uniref:Uncharacterized protein n=1 Tax=Mugilogobius chulae TaxID=88201 RepID=A0AAW0MM82_9GOBI
MSFPPLIPESAQTSGNYQPKEELKLSADLPEMSFPPLISESAQTSGNYQPKAGLRETDFWGFFCQTNFEHNLPTELSELSDKSNISKPNFEQKQPVSLVSSSEMPFPAPESLESTKDSRNSDLYQTRSEHKTPVSPSERSAEHLRPCEDFGQGGDTQMHPSLIDEIRNASSQETSSGETEIQSTDEPIIEEVQIETSSQSSECDSSRTPADCNIPSETSHRATTPEVIDANNIHSKTLQSKNMSTQLDDPSSDLEMAEVLDILKEELSELDDPNNALEMAEVLDILKEELPEDQSDILEDIVKLFQDDVLTEAQTVHATQTTSKSFFSRLFSRLRKLLTPRPRKSVFSKPKWMKRFGVFKRRSTTSGPSETSFQHQQQ